MSNSGVCSLYRMSKPLSSAFSVCETQCLPDICIYTLGNLQCCYNETESTWFVGKQDRTKSVYKTRGGWHGEYSRECIKKYIERNEMKNSLDE